MPDFLFESEQKLNELVKKAESLQYGTPIDVFIKDTPIDWAAISANFGAAFFGALAAFAFNALFEYRKEKARRRSQINSAINHFAITLTALLNFKNQFLIDHAEELETLRMHAGQYGNLVDEKLIQEFHTKIKPLLSNETNHPFSSGALKGWEEIEFIHINAPETLSFFSDSKMPDSIRIFALVGSQTLQLRKAISARNAFREKHVGIIAAHGIQPHPEIMHFIYEMLDYRKNTLEYVDVALVCIKESTDLIRKYVDKYYPDRKKPWKWILKNRTWVKYQISKKMESLMPNRADYLDILEPDLEETESPEQPAASNQNPT